MLHHYYGSMRSGPHNGNIGGVSRRWAEGIKDVMLFPRGYAMRQMNSIDGDIDD